MYTPIATSTLHTGETLEIGVVLAPDDEYAPLVRPLLTHKSSKEQWHLDEVFAGRVSPLETRFYLGRVNERPVCNIMVSEHDGIGIVSHVYTVPEHRRKGIARQAMTGQMADFTARGGRYLTLVTDYGAHPYRLYWGFGFRSVRPKAGHMKFKTDAGSDLELYEAGEARVIQADWKSWPSLNVLCAQHDLPVLRNVAFGHLGPRMFEYAYLDLMHNLREDPMHQVRLLAADRGAVTGYGTLVPDTRWRGETCLLDLFVHPAFAACWGPLLDSFSLPDERKVQCHVQAGDKVKSAALLDAGFIHEATLRKQFRSAGQAMDVEVYARLA